MAKAASNTRPRNDERALLDSISAERLQKLIVIETTESAKKELIDWAKWLVGGIVALFTILGITTYTDLKSKIDTMATATAKILKDETDQIAKAHKETMSASLRSAELETSQLREKVQKLQAEMDLQRNRVDKQVEITLKQISERGGAIPTQLSVQVQIATRAVYDAKGGSRLPGVLIRSDDQGPSTDETANKVYGDLGIVLNFWRTVMSHHSYDGQGAKVSAAVHYDQKLSNAFWDGQQIVIGDGDGVMFANMAELTILASQFTHAVVERTAGFRYMGQSGALNMHVSDVFAVLVEQWHLQQKADQATWLVGAGVFGSQIKAKGLRSLKAPGTAYDDPILGQDPQPDHMKKYAEKTETASNDNGGVHINSGIPNHAFYLTATKIGGFAWEKAGKIWYEALLASSKNDDFQKFATTTLVKAEALYGKESDESKAVRDGWRAVGIELKS